MINDKLLLEAFEAGQSKYAIAKRSGVSQSTVGRWMRGDLSGGIRLDTAEALARALGYRLVLAPISGTDGGKRVD